MGIIKTVGGKWYILITVGRKLAISQINLLVQVLFHAANIDTYNRTRLSCINGTMPLFLSFLCKISWSPFTYSYLNFTSQILSLFLPNPWILQRPINGKSAPSVAVVGQKRQRELWRTKPKWWRHRKLEKPQRIEAGILWLFTASISSFPNALRRQGWHGDDRHHTSFRSVPTLVGGVAGNENKIWVRLTRLFLQQGWHGDDWRRTIFRSVPTLAGGVDGNGNEIRIGFVGICDKERVLW